MFVIKKYQNIKGMQPFWNFCWIENHNLLQTHLDLAYICFKVVSNIYQLSIML